MKDKKEENLEEQNIQKIDIVDEMESSFLDYAMSVIISRALPDIRDGLKPVHRRILYAMNELEMTHSRPYKKSARIVGEVIGKYHPHGDSAVYESLVRMAQDFSLRYPLVEGQGNFGSIDGDSAAAMRYTEARMAPISDQLLLDIKMNTVDFVPNYDGSEDEPTILPSQIPNILMNGSTGIAVGMATNIPPHNLNEIVDALIAVAKNNEIDDFDLLNLVQGPDFPTGATILGNSGIKEAYLNGSGTLIIQSKVEVINNEKSGSKLIITEVPYMVNKAKLIEKIAELIREKRIDSIRDIRDETNREGIRVVIELKRGYNADVELNKLYKTSQLQTTFSINLLVISDGQPKVMKLKDILMKYLDFSEEVLIRKTKFKLKRSRERVHILEGIKIAIENIDNIIKIIKNSKKTSDAMLQLEKTYNLSKKQAKSVLEMRLQRLTGLEIEKIIKELEHLLSLIKKYEELINKKDSRVNKIISDLIEIKEKYGDERRTQIVKGEIKSIDDESLIPMKNVVITISESGYIKRVPLEIYEAQNRGGIGKVGMKTHDEDDIRSLIVTSTHSDVMFFTNTGKVYKVRAHKIPVFGRHSKGIPIINLINIEKKEEVKAMLPITIYDDNHFLIFATRNGIIKKTSLTNFNRINRNGKIALGLKPKDEVLDVKKCESGSFVLIGSKHGKVITFEVDKLRALGRTAAGVKGMDVAPNSIINLEVAKSRDEKILSVSELGFGKLTTLEEYRVTSRGGKGVISLNTKKAGAMAAIRIVKETDDLLITTNHGTLIRINVSQISKTSRNAKGVIIKKVKGDEILKSIAVIKHSITEDLENEDTIAIDISNETETEKSHIDSVKNLNIENTDEDDE